ncbi:MAG: hypothetical protein GY701_35705 [Sulfitobacter sp.]|nr:hypothetical protein [Sulfitobacter sp.]
MALLVRGRTRCVVCDRVVEDSDAAIALPAFVRDRTSELFRFSDGILHTACLETDSLAQRAARLAQETIDRLGPGSRSCEVCGEEVRDPDDYLTLGFLSDEAGSPASSLNWLQFHRSHLHLWEHLQAAIETLESLSVDKGWCEEDTVALVRELRSHAW